MTAEPRRCPYYGKELFPSIFHPDQRICSAPQCQKRRQIDCHRSKYHADAEYRLVCRDSDQKWRIRNPDYQRSYRQEHPAYVEQNRRAQNRRDSRRRVHDPVKNNLAFDLKSISVDIWLVGSELGSLENLNTHLVNRKSASHAGFSKKCQ